MYYPVFSVRFCGLSTISLKSVIIKHAQRPIPKDAFFYQAKDT